MEGDLICVPVDPKGVVSPRSVQEENVQARYRRDQERNEKVESEKSRERRVIHGKPPPKPGNKAGPEIGEGGE